MCLLGYKKKVLQPLSNRAEGSTVCVMKGGDTGSSMLTLLLLFFELEGGIKSDKLYDIKQCIIYLLLLV